jgi:hypothetical protein
MVATFGSCRTFAPPTPIPIAGGNSAGRSGRTLAPGSTALGTTEPTEESPKTKRGDLDDVEDCLLGLHIGLLKGFYLGLIIAYYRAKELLPLLKARE